MTVYEISFFYYTGRTREVTGDICPLGFVASPPPSLQAGEWARLSGGAWEVTTEPPPPIYFGSAGGGGGGGPAGPATPAEARDLRISQVEAQSDVLLSTGFTYDSTVFSLSNVAQSNWVALKVAHLSDGITYPYDVSSITGAAYTIADSTDMGTFLAAAFARINAVKGPDGAVALRDEIVAIFNDGQLTDAQKITNIMAVVDDRT